jgi:hypothetical protein
VNPSTQDIPEVEDEEERVARLAHEAEQELNGWWKT